jgi:hypothetical protein
MVLLHRALASRQVTVPPASQCAVQYRRGHGHRQVQCYRTVLKTCRRACNRGDVRARLAAAEVQPSGSEDEASFFIRNLRALPWQRAAVWLIVATAAFQLSDFFGVRHLRSPACLHRTMDEARRVEQQLVQPTWGRVSRAQWPLPQRCQHFTHAQVQAALMLQPVQSSHACSAAPSVTRSVDHADCDGHVHTHIRRAQPH